MCLMLAALPEYPSVPDSLAYQLTGLAVVFIALGGIWGLLEISGACFRRINAHHAGAAEPVPELPPASQIATPSAGVAPLTHALVAASVHAFFRGRARIVSVGETPPEHVRVLIAATVHSLFHGRARIISVDKVQPDTSWAREGRRDIFSSHRVR